MVHEQAPFFKKKIFIHNALFSEMSLMILTFINKFQI